MANGPSPDGLKLATGDFEADQAERFKILGIKPEGTASTGTYDRVQPLPTGDGFYPPSASAPRPADRLVSEPEAPAESLFVAPEPVAAAPEAAEDPFGFDWDDSDGYPDDDGGGLPDGPPEPPELSEVVAPTPEPTTPEVLLSDQLEQRMADISEAMADAQAKLNNAAGKDTLMNQVASLERLPDDLQRELSDTSYEAEQAAWAELTPAKSSKECADAIAEKELWIKDAEAHLKQLRGEGRTLRARTLEESIAQARMTMGAFVEPARPHALRELGRGDRGGSEASSGSLSTCSPKTSKIARTDVFVTTPAVQVLRSVGLYKVPSAKDAEPVWDRLLAALAG